MSTSSTWWRLPRTTALSSTALIATSGSLRLPFMAQLSLPRACAARSCQNPSPAGPSNPWLTGKASVLSRLDKLPPTLHTWPICQKDVPTRTMCQVGLQSLYRCSIPAPQSLDLPNPHQCYPGVLCVSKPVVVQTDTSKHGLEAAFIQSGCPIVFISKTLTDIETRYANIERESLSVWFGLEKSHTYLYGRHVIIENDHKLLEMIKHKPIHAFPPRASADASQCMQTVWLHHQVYKPGKDMVLADNA